MAHRITESESSMLIPVKLRNISQEEAMKCNPTIFNKSSNYRRIYLGDTIYLIPNSITPEPPNGFICVGPFYRVRPTKYSMYIYGICGHIAAIGD